MITAADLDVERIGTGPPVLFVHGSIVDARRTFRCQDELAEYWTVCLVNRPGFGSSPELQRGDPEVEAPLIAELLGDGAYLVGHSYGAVIALLAAALRPQAVRALVVSEPGSLQLGAGDPLLDAMIENGNRLYASGETISTAEWLRWFRAGVHSAHETPEELPDWLEHGARLAARERPPWEVALPLAGLRAAPFPKLVISGGHSPAFELICDVLSDQIGGERAVIPGRGHTIPTTGEAYNSRVHEFLLAAQGLGGSERA